MIYFAYDGSINCDWVSHYAVSMAARSPDRRLQVVHILDGRIPSDRLGESINAIEKNCRRRKVEMSPLILPLKKNIAHSLLGAIPPGKDVVCVCGTRMRSRLKGFFTGTVSEKLIAARRFGVMALRVVQPGLLGTPHRVLLPFSSNPGAPAAALPFVRLFGEDLKEVRLLRVMSLGLLRIAGPERVRALHRRGREYLNRARDILGEEFDNGAHLDTRVIVSNDWPDEILIQASKLKAGLILMGATERFLPARFSYGNRLEQVLRGAHCDVAVYRGPAA